MGNAQQDFFLSAPTVMIQDAIPRLDKAIKYHDNIVCSVSGGADSDILVDMTWRLDPDAKTKYVFFDTGLEMKATREQIDFLQKKYGIEIKTIKPKQPVAYVVRKHGYPFHSKLFSEFISRLQRHGFKWEDRPFSELLAEYPDCKAALRWWCNAWKDGPHKPLSTEIASAAYLKEFMVKNPPAFPISPKCCDFSKKRPAKEAAQNADLTLIGIRKLEGGARSKAYKSCFVDGKHGKQHFPLFWFDSKDKAEYEAAYNVTHSKAYTVYGCSRTGCAACPFASRFEDELKMLEQYEPELARAVGKIFAPSYEYTRAYRKFKEEQKATARGGTK